VYLDSSFALTIATGILSIRSILCMKGIICLALAAAAAKGQSKDLLVL
jgi:hypothetical protein